jgi:hypothetical protein
MVLIACGHGLDGDGDEAFRQRLRRGRPPGRRLDLGGQALELRPHRIGVQRRVAARPEDGGEELRPQLAQQDVAVGHRQRPAAAIGGRSRHGARALRPDPQPRSVEAADGAAARRHRLDRQHRRPQPHARRPRCPRSAHSRRHSGTRRSRCRPCRSRRHGRSPRRAPSRPFRRPRPPVPTGWRPCPGKARARQPAVRLHEQQGRRLAQIGADPVDIGAQHRRQIGVGHRRIAAPDQLDQGADVMADRDLFEPDLARDLRQPRLVRCPAPAVHQDDGDRGQSPRPRRLESARAFASSSGVSTSPSTPTRSAISTTLSYSGGLSTMWRANSSGRLCQPILSASPKPR